MRRPDGDEFFRRDGLLFLPPEKIQATLEQAGRGQALLGPLAADPSLRGLMDAFGMVSTAVQTQRAQFKDFTGPLGSLGDVFEEALNGKTPFFSWRKLMTGEEPTSRDLRRFIEAKPKLDYSSLEPGAAATSVIRAAAADLGLTPDKGVRVRLTGDVPMADEEFATVQEHAWVNNIGTVLIVLVLLFTALKSPKIVFAVYASVAVGLIVTAAAGLAMVGALNLISIAFAVLFIGIGADFGIQFSVRYRAERHADDNLLRSLDTAAERAGRPLALAATATACGFLAFVPTVYRGVSELGLIAGVGHDHRLSGEHHRPAGAPDPDAPGPGEGAGRLQVLGARRSVHRTPPLCDRVRHARHRARRHAASAQPHLRLQPAEPAQQPGRVRLDAARSHERSGTTRRTRSMCWRRRWKPRSRCRSAWPRFPRCARS